MTRRSNAFLVNKRLAEQSWGKLSPSALASLKALTFTYGLSVGRGDITCLDGRWYVTHSGLLGLSFRRHCSGMHVEIVPDFCDPPNNRWTFKATVFRTGKRKGYVGYGDADPSNVSSLVRGAELRIAETRAVNRALRKAYGIGVCSVEEMGSQSAVIAATSVAQKFPPKGNNKNGNGSAHKIRDRLCQIIRQHKLDPELVKAYAVDFCGTNTLRDATREQVENFVRQLADAAKTDRDSLLCLLNSYARPSQGVVA